MCLKYLNPLARFNEELRRMLQSGLIMKWKTVIIYLQTALLSSHMTVPAQMYWPAENECTASARGGISPTAIVTVSDMQVSAGYRVFRGGQYRVLLQTLSRAPSRCWLRASSSPSRCWQWSCAAARGLGAARRASATHSLPEHQQCSE